MQTFLDGEENQNTKRETALVIAFLAAGNENRQLEDLPSADFGRLPESCFCNHGSAHFSFLRVRANTLYDCYSGIFDSFIFIENSRPASQ